MYPTIMRRLLALISVFILCFSFTACGSDGQAAADDPIVGTWEMAEITAGNRQVDAQEYRKAADVSRAPALTFEADGTVTLDMDGESGVGTWTQEGGRYTITYRRGDRETSTGLNLTEGLLIMEQDGYTLTYQK